MVAMNRHQNRNRIAEVVINHRAHYAVGKIRRTSFRHVEPQLGPELFRVLEAVFQLDIDEHRAVHTGRVGLLAPYSFDLEQPLLDFLSDLVLDFRGGCTWVKRRDNSGAYMNLRVFSARHAEQSIGAGGDQHHGEGYGHLGIAKREPYGIHRAPPAIWTEVPSRSFCWPPTTTCSSLFRPERISTSSPMGGPTSMRLA